MMKVLKTLEIRSSLEVFKQSHNRKHLRLNRVQDRKRIKIGKANRRNSKRNKRMKKRKKKRNKHLKAMKDL
jgi:hypothetical protein